MKREEIKSIFAEATDEQIDKVLNINGSDIKKFKDKVTALEEDAKANKDTYDNLNKELSELKDRNASADDWKSKFENLQTEIQEKEKKAAEEKAAKEKNESINHRIDAVIGDKKFSHEAVRECYVRKFAEALESKEYEGKSDADIMHELTKDDKAAFAGVNAYQLLGGEDESDSPSNPLSRFF